MSGKFMSVKRYIIPTITMVIIASQLMGCAAANSNQLLEMINRGDQIEIEVAVPINEEQGTEQSILWEQLASLTTNDVLRKEWDNTLGIINTDTGKNGILYVNAVGENDNNNTLRMALHNRAFVQYLESENGIESLAEASLNQYADIEAEETMKAVYMGINGYFNLLPDATPNYSNPDSTLSRLEFMSMVMRAETPVQEIESDSAFATAVGSNDLNIYAQEVADSSYLDLASKSLNNQTANGTMTRAEAVYLLMQRYFSDELANVDVTGITFSDCKDGGNIAEQQKFIENGVKKDFWKSYEIVYSLANPDNGVSTDIYKAMCLAQQKGIITSETRFDEGITKVEAVEMLVETLKSEPSIEIFNATMGTINGYEVTEKEPEVEQDSSVNSTSDNIEYEEGEYQGNNPNDVANKPDTDKSAFDEAMETKDPNADSGLTVGPDGYATDGVGLDLDKDGIITNFEAEFWQGIMDRTPAYPTTNDVPSGSTTTPDGGSTIPGPTGQQGNLVEGGGALEDEVKGPTINPGQGDYTGGEGGIIY